MKSKEKIKRSKKKTYNEITFCRLPAVPERKLDEFIDPNRLSLIRYHEKKWVNNTVLHFYFMGNRPEWIGADDQKQTIRNAFQEWKDLGLGLEFKEVVDPTEAEIRIGFEPGSSWSYVGRDCIDLVSDPAQRTMNFGWDLTTNYGKDTALHEIGHALGFPHEHQNPNAGIVWNEEAVYNYFGGYPNYWDKDTTFYNVIRKISFSEIDGSKWDNNSIMHYQFNAGLIMNPATYQTEPLIPAPGLSQYDIDEVIKFYPGDDGTEMKALKPFLSQLLEIEPGEQLDFVITPLRTRNYTIQTFGEMDTVIVLFEGNNGLSEYVDGDDDSGYNYNSKISVRLLRGRTYYLRVRLYYTTVTGTGAIMLW